MQIRFHCPTESCVAIIEYEPLEESASTIRCPRCRVEHPVHIDDAIRHHSRIDKCPLCSCEELFVRKDFPPGIGLAVVLIAGVISVATLTTHAAIAYGVLLLAILIDLVLYLLIGKLTACYACRAEYRDAKLNPNHEGFDLATSEKY
ncbi:MAG: hypothetical protein ACE5GE_14075 [Phycisphaerae bacterium]